MKRNEDVAGGGGGGHFKASVSSELQASYQNGGGGGGLQRPTIMASTSGGGGGGGSSVAASALANVKYEHLVAGISGGIASTLALHPLDLLKVRLAGKLFYLLSALKLHKLNFFSIFSILVNDGLVVTRPQYTGLTNAVTTIFRQEGIRGFYRGVTPNCWGAGASWGLYFLL